MERNFIATGAKFVPKMILLGLKFIPIPVLITLFIYIYLPNLARQHIWHYKRLLPIHFSLICSCSLFCFLFCFLWMIISLRFHYIYIFLLVSRTFFYFFFKCFQTFTFSCLCIYAHILQFFFFWILAMHNRTQDLQEIVWQSSLFFHQSYFHLIE